MYVHRIGRTGRIGREGVAITLAGPRDHRFLRSVEALTRQKIEILNLPSVADLKARRLEATREAMRARSRRAASSRCGRVVESLVQEFDVLDVAAAAIHLVHEASEKSIPQEVIPARAAPEGRQEGRPQGFGPRPSGAGRAPAGRPRQRY